MPATLRLASKHFGNTVALDGVDLDVRLLLGLARPTSGEAREVGRDPREAPTRQRIGAMLQVGKAGRTTPPL